MAVQTVRLGSSVDVLQYDDLVFASGIECSGPISAGSLGNCVLSISFKKTPGEINLNFLALINYLPIMLQ